MFTFTPLLGAQSSSEATQSLLEFDGGVKILVDVGWDNTFDAEKLRELERQTSTISLVLLTHADIAHVGAFAHCCKHVPLFNKIPVYATAPVIALGRTLLQDLYSSTPLAASFLPINSIEDINFASPDLNTPLDANILLPPPTKDEISEYFSLIYPLKFSQSHQPTSSPLLPPLDGLTITPYCAGHTLGGSIWHVQQGSESVVYAVDWNQGRENVFPGAAWLNASGSTGAEVTESLRVPTALICSSKVPSESGLSLGRKQRDDALLELIRTATSAGGDVLIPCDTSARVLEIIYFLDQAWSSKSDSLYHSKLYLAGHSCDATLRYARSMLEWMDESIVREFEAEGNKAANTHNQANTMTPFNLKNVVQIQRASQLYRALATNGSKVFVASDSSLEWGFSKSILRHVASNPQNLVILPQRLQRTEVSGSQKPILETLWNFLYDTTEGQPEATQVPCQGLEIEIGEVTTAALNGQEVLAYQQYLANQRQRQSFFQTEQGAGLETSADVVDDRSSSSSSSDEDDDTEHQGKVLNVSAALAHPKHKFDLTDEELGVNVLLRRRNVHDYDVRGRKGRERMFPFVAKRRRVDDFGDLIRPEEYLRAEEREKDDNTTVLNGTTNENSGLGQKRRWDDLAHGKFDSKRKLPNNSFKRRQSEGDARSHGQEGLSRKTQEDPDPDPEEESEDSDYEPAEPTVKGPVRANFSRETISLNTSLATIDYSGIHDKRSLHMLIPLIKPRKLVLIAGTEEETSALAADCRKLLGAAEGTAHTASSAEIFTPTNGTVVDASVDTNAWTIKLSQALFKRLRWQKFRDLGIVTINGALEIDSIEEGNESAAPKKQKLSGFDEKAVPENPADASDSAKLHGMPILNELPANKAGSGRSANQALHVGDLRLAELRKLMQAHGHSAEFKGEGTLLVDGIIAVRKSGIGRIEVEAGGVGNSGMAARSAGSSFFNVKQKIYEGLAVVAAR